VGGCRYVYVRGESRELVNVAWEEVACQCSSYTKLHPVLCLPYGKQGRFIPPLGNDDVRIVELEGTLEAAVTASVTVNVTAQNLL
jgi:hypothetical protein